MQIYKKTMNIKQKNGKLCLFPNAERQIPIFAFVFTI